MTDLVGVVPLEGRGSLPMAMLHGESLFLHSVRALLDIPGLLDVVVTAETAQLAAADRALGGMWERACVVRAGDWWADPMVSFGSAGVVLLDPLCPLVPADFVALVLERAGQDRCMAGYRPVTDTVKSVVDEQIVGTIDRGLLAIITSPVVIPARLAKHGAPPARDFAAVAAWLRQHDELELVKAPSMARRLGDESAVQVLECVDELAHRVRER